MITLVAGRKSELIHRIATQLVLYKKIFTRILFNPIEDTKGVYLISFMVLLALQIEKFRLLRHQDETNSNYDSGTKRPQQKRPFNTFIE